MIPVWTVLIATGCGGWNQKNVDGLRQVENAFLANSDGQIRVFLPIEDGEAAVQFTVIPEVDHTIALSAVKKGGSTVLDAATLDPDRAFTNATDQSTLSVMQWPSRGQDEALDGGTWEFVYNIFDAGNAAARSATADITALIKEDAQLDQGTLRVEVLYAGTAAEDDAIRTGTAAALVEAEEIFGAAGVTLDISESDYPESYLPPPGYGAFAEYEELSDSGNLRAIKLVVVPEFIGEDFEHWLGHAGGTPGTLLPTDRSAVTVSALANMGLDLQFDEREIELYGQTIAHELGHYMGLYHPVSLPDYDTWDALADTPECSDQATCQDDLSGNLMYPTQVCSDGTCVDRVAVTDNQAQVLQLYVGVE